MTHEGPVVRRAVRPGRAARPVVVSGQDAQALGRLLARRQSVRDRLQPFGARSMSRRTSIACPSATASGSRGRSACPASGFPIRTGRGSSARRRSDRGQRYAMTGARSCQVGGSGRRIARERRLESPPAGGRPDALAYHARRFLRTAGMADRSGEARRPLSATGAGERAVARSGALSGRSAGGRDRGRHQAAGGGGARHHYRWRDPARELLQPVRDRARGNRHRQSRASPSTAPAIPIRFPASSARSAAGVPSKSRTSSSCAVTRRAW